jgi:hypothetical protein
MREELVATLEGDGTDRTSYISSVLRAASADYQPQPVTRFGARIEAR